MSYTREQLLERAAFLEKHIEPNSVDYSDATMRMEAWALRTAAAIAGAGKWLPPIGTAPRDGSEIMLVSIQPQEDGMAYISISNGSWSDEEGCFVLGAKGSKFNSVGDGCATHWLPVDWLFTKPGSDLALLRDAIARTIHDVSNRWIAPNFPDHLLRPFDELSDQEKRLHFEYADAVVALAYDVGSGG